MVREGLAAWGGQTQGRHPADPGASALLKLCVEEEGADLVRGRRQEATSVATSLVTLVEARAELARRRHQGDVTAAEHRNALASFTGDWERLVRIGLNERLADRAAQLAEVHRLRAYDAIQLASGLLFAERLGEDTLFGSGDDALDAAAAREGLQLLRAE
jgi:predicted nucleic acid-binding protein